MRVAWAIAVFAFFGLAGCSPTTSTGVAPDPPKPAPFLEISSGARAVLRQIATDQQLGPEWWVRLEVVWKPDAQIEVNLDRKPPRASDLVVEANGLQCVMAVDQRDYLKGARIDLFTTNEGIGFDVTFPHRDSRDRQLAAEWLRRETAKRGLTKEKTK
jgi:Fe-S cluster assembly iron-binding protein IscA